MIKTQQKRIHHAHQKDHVSPLSTLILIYIQKSGHGQPMTGYLLTQVLSDIWAASHQQVYKELKRLASLGYIQRRVIHQAGSPDMKQISLTQLGAAVLDRLKSQLPKKVEIDVYRDELMIQIALGNTQYLREYAARLNQKIKDINSILEMKSQSLCCDNLRKMNLERLRLIYTANLHFVECTLLSTPRLDIEKPDSYSTEDTLIANALP